MKKFIISLLIVLLCMTSVFATDGERPSVAVVLSGGGAKGIAHIAALKALEEHGIPIDRVYGTSMGALIGGIYCAGYSPDDIYSLVTDNDLNSMFKTILSPGYEEMPQPYNFDRNNIVSIAVENGVVGTTALLDDYAIMNFFDNAVGNIPEDIDFLTDLETPFTCNAADMINGGQTVFTHGNLITAMRASMSIPVAFEPVFSETGDVYTDGGLYRNIMVKDAVEDGYDIVIAVYLPTDARKLSENNFKSLSGLVEGTVISVLSNGSLGQIEMASYGIPIDVSGFSVLGFDKGKEVYERGLEEVAKSEPVFQEIAARFTDEQKEFKNPGRHGVYFSKYPDVEKTMRFPAYDEQHEDAYAKTRISLGLGGMNSFSHYPDYYDDPEYYPNPNKNTIMVLPYLSARTFFKDINKTNLSLEGKIKIELSRSCNIDVNALYRFNKDKGERVYGLLGTSVQFASLGYWTDTKANVSIHDGLEYKLGLNAGIQLTNERSHNIVLKGYADYFKTYENLSGYNYEPSKTWYNRAELGAVFYTSQATGFLGHTSKRVDALARAGWLRTTDSEMVMTYFFAFFADSSFQLSDLNSVSVDIEAFSSREPGYLRSSYSEYGGWDGIPGVGCNTLYREFIMAGGTFEHLLHEGFVDTYLIVQARAGVHTTEETFLEGLSPFSLKEDVKNLPFSNCLNSIRNNLKESLDYGIGIGIGFDSAIGGDAIFGIGYNNRKMFSVYLEIK